MKAQLQAKLARNKDQHGKALPFGFVKCLPADTKEAPLAMQELCFPDGQTPTLPWPLEVILTTAKDIPMRKTRKDVSVSQVPSAMLQSLTPQCVALMQGFLLHGLAMHGASFQQETPLTMLRPQPKHAQLNCLLDKARSNSSEFSQQSPPLALEDAPPALPAASTQGTLALQDKAQSMKVELPEAQPEKPQVPPSEPPQVEPKACPNAPEMACPGSLEKACPGPAVEQPGRVTLSQSLERMQQARGTLKRPAAAVNAPQKKPAKMDATGQAMKKQVRKNTKPAPKSAGAKQVGEKSLSKSELKEKLLKSIPAHLKAEKKKGCSKCRWVPFCTISCWAGRGWTI